MPQIYQPHQTGKCKYLTYSEESLQLCMEATKFGALFINKTSRQYKKPPRTIHNKLSNIHTNSVGPPVLYKLAKYHHQTVFTSQVIQ